jgi:hypothetical protein
MVAHEDVEQDRAQVALGLTGGRGLLGDRIGRHLDQVEDGVGGHIGPFVGRVRATIRDHET